MRKPYKQEIVTLMVNPWMLRKMADEMEKRMADLGVGERVWSETFHDDIMTCALQVVLLADQDWFHKRREGIPNWDAMAPGPEALARFPLVKNESREFPDTYSGAAWNAAYRIWKATEEHGPEILDSDVWSDIKGADCKGLGLSGFQFGWARNAVRQMLGKAPVENPAIVTVGGPAPVVPASGSAEDDMKGAIGG